MTGQQNSSVAIGHYAGMTGQGSSSVAIGVLAGGFNQIDNAVAIGSLSGQTNQGLSAVAIGVNAGMTDQKYNAVAIGNLAGLDTQGNNSVAIGNQAGFDNQGNSAVAIGNQAGENNQGLSAVAIGTSAGQTNQAEYSIVINASGSVLNNTVANTCKIAPIRTIGPVAFTGTIMYDITTNELVVDTNKTFVIDHPLDKNKYLVHACLEGPESGVYYRGKGEIKDKSCEITLPNYVDSLATEFTVQVTQTFDGHDFANLLTTDVVNNKFTVYGGKCKFFWHVHGKRGHINVEPDKDSVKVKGDGPYKYCAVNI